MNKCIGLFTSILTCAALSFTAFAEGDIVQTLVSDDNVVAELVSTEGDIASGYTWNLHVENKTDKDIQITMDNTVVNGLSLDPYWTERIPAGESSDSQAVWSPDMFSKVDMTGDITEVRSTLRAFDLTDYDTFLQEDISVRPNGDEVVYYERTPLDSDLVVFSKDDYEMILIDSELNQWDEFQLNAYVVNKGDSMLLIQGTDWKINGSIECDPFWSVMLAPHTAAYTNISWSDWSLQGTGITAFESIDCNINIMDWENWETLDTTSLSVTLSDPVPVSGGDTSLPFGSEPAPEPRKNLEIDSVQNVLESGAEGKTWTEFFEKE